MSTTTTPTRRRSRRPSLATPDWMRPRTGWTAAAVIAVAAPWLVDERQVFVLMMVLILAVFATSYNILLGNTGMVSFAHASYYGVGAYAVTLSALHLGWSPLLGMALAPVAAGALGYLTGLVALRATRLYFALLTLAIGQLMYVVMFQWRTFTRGDDGIHGLRLPDVLGPTLNRYYFLLLLAALAIAIMGVAMRSPFGATLRAIRENRDRAGFLGIKVKRYELAAFTLGSAFAGWAGGMYAIFDRGSFPLLLHWTTSAEPIFVTLIGGMNSFAGPVVGAVIFGLLRDYVTRNFVYWGVVLGLVLLTLILFLPGGTVEGLKRLWARFTGGPPPEGDPAAPDHPGVDEPAPASRGGVR
ncbi:branched-chain amino acid ABC transporter permease [Egicoccus sp. AB-alg6-2]|uniref:branched-chain amino acid ABC transporter permease n=1 Tax=Egicoccus sp. AB-alg6-2 TaxID=3242692 RepID=UPI00359DFCA1